MWLRDTGCRLLLLPILAVQPSVLECLKHSRICDCCGKALQEYHTPPQRFSRNAFSYLCIISNVQLQNTFNQLSCISAAGTLTQIRLTRRIQFPGSDDVCEVDGYRSGVTGKYILWAMSNVYGSASDLGSTLHQNPIVRKALFFGIYIYLHSCDDSREISQIVWIGGLRRIKSWRDIFVGSQKKVNGNFWPWTK